MAEYIRVELDKVPKGSRLEKYLTELPQVIKGNKNIILAFFEDAFVECLEFVKHNTKISYLPSIRLNLVKSAEFKRQARLADKRAISREIPKNPANVIAFVVGNASQQNLFIDLEGFVDLLNFGYLTFALNLVQTYFHKILHIAYRMQRSEQEIYGLGCSMTEAFLGIELPEELKNLKETSYYSKKDNQN